MSKAAAVPVFSVRGVSNRALKTAFTQLRDALGITSADDADEPRWGPDDGCARLRKKDYSLQLLFFCNYDDHRKDELTVAYFGKVPGEELKVILSVLNEHSLPENL
jgi:hypothetical protein